MKFEDWRYQNLRRDTGKYFWIVSFLGIHAYPSFLTLVNFYFYFYFIFIIFHFYFLLFYFIYFILFLFLFLFFIFYFLFFIFYFLKIFIFYKMGSIPIYFCGYDFVKVARDEFLSHNSLNGSFLKLIYFFLDFFGIFILFVSVVGQYLADDQLYKHRKSKNNQQVLNTGVWSLTRHPNYLFEITFWYFKNIFFYFFSFFYFF